MFTNEPQKLVSDAIANLGVVKYSLDGVTYSDKIPVATNVGIYKVYYKIEDGEHYYGVAPQSVLATISKGYSMIEIPPKPSAYIEYTGEEQILISSGVSNFGTILYKLGEDGVYSPTLPTAILPGSYKIYYKIAETDDYYGTSEKMVTSIVEPVTPADDTPAHNGIKVWFSHGIVVIDGAQIGMSYHIIDPSGRIIASSTIHSSHEEIHFTKAGVLIIYVSGMSYKVCVR